jgi:hypothetical protein
MEPVPTPTNSALGLMLTAQAVRRKEAARGMLLDLLEQKFGSVTPATKLRVGSADLEQVTRWSRKVFSANRDDTRIPSRPARIP